jgi:hypothetical protein
MLPPLMQLLALRPPWLAEHLAAYAELAAAECAEAAAAGRRRLALGLLTLGAVGVAATLAGVALMLWAALPTLPAQTAWLLLATPALPLAVALAGAVALRPGSPGGHFVVLRQQLQADLALLREAAAA